MWKCAFRAYRMGNKGSHQPVYPHILISASAAYLLGTIDRGLYIGYLSVYVCTFFQDDI